MAVISTENQTLSNVIKRQLWGDINYNSEVVVINDSAATLQIGTVLGKVTATGKYKVAVETAVDGSKVADAIVEKVVTILGATDTNILVSTRGPASISKGGLILGATYDTQAKKDAVYASLVLKGFQVLETV